MGVAGFYDLGVTGQSQGVSRPGFYLEAVEENWPHSDS